MCFLWQVLSGGVYGDLLTGLADAFELHHAVDLGKQGAVGTHTHVGTIDAQVLPQGTAYVTDIGMTGPINSVIGDDIESVLQRFLTIIPNRLSVGKGKTMLNAVMIKVDEQSGNAISIERIDREVE